MKLVTDGQKSPCGAAKVGDVLTARNCSTNGLAVDDQEWELKSSWQLKHIPSGLCAEAESLAAGSKVKLAECHPIGAEEGDLQQFTNDYTRIRNAMAPMTLSDRQVNYPNHFVIVVGQYVHCSHHLVDAVDCLFGGTHEICGVRCAAR